MAKKGIELVVENNKTKSKNIDKLVKLSLNYIDKINEANSFRPAKIKFAESGKYDKAAIERNKETQSLREADVIFKKMKKVRKLLTS